MARQLSLRPILQSDVGVEGEDPGLTTLRVVVPGASDSKVARPK